MSVVPRGLHIFIESGHRGRTFDPFAGLRSGVAVIEIVINGRGRLVLVDLGFVDTIRQREPAYTMLFSKISSAMFHCIWNSPEPGCRRVIFIERVVDHGAVIGVPALRRVAAERNARGIGVINEIVPRRDVTAWRGSCVRSPVRFRNRHRG